jgi:small subunit ribosomal protein S4e
MANHGRSRHSKRLALPKILPVSRKGIKYVKKPSAGRHPHVSSMSMLMLLHEILKVCKDKREAKMVLSAGKVLLDGRVTKDPGIPVGLLDVVHIPALKACYQMVMVDGHLVPASIPVDTSSKLCKVTGKKLIGGGRIQLALNDGRAYVIEREEDRFSVGDTLKIKFPKQALAGFIKLEKGARCYVYSGKHSGKLGTLEEVLERAGSAPADVRLAVGPVKIITRKDYVLAVDDTFALPKIEHKA